VHGGQSWALVCGGHLSALVHGSGRSWAFMDVGWLLMLVRGGFGPSLPLMGGDGGSLLHSWILFAVS